MTHVRYGAIARAIAQTVGVASEVSRVQTGDERTEGMNDVPTLQVYFVDETGETVSFGRAIQNNDLTYNVDIYVRARAHLGDDTRLCQEVADGISAILEAEQKPYFGIDAIKGFSARLTSVAFEYAQVAYVGLRYVLTIKVF